MRNAATTTSTRAIDAVNARGPTKVRWRIFLLMLMLIAINYIDRASISVAMPVISKEFDHRPQRRRDSSSARSSSPTR